MFRYNSYKSALKTTCITQQPLYFHYLSNAYNKDIWNKRLGHYTSQGRNYDVYEYDDPLTGKIEKVYFDITYFLGRSPLLLDPTRMNLPTMYVDFIKVKDFFGDDLIDEIFNDLNTDVKENIKDKMLYFQTWPNSFISNFIAFYNVSENVVEVFPIRELDDYGYPLLFGFHFYILFIIHQLTHYIQGHNPFATEAPVKGHFNNTSIGIDCISFQPLKEFTFVNDFVNYLFWTHQPNSFKSENEKDAFLRMVNYAFKNNYFTKDELLRAFSDSNAEKDTLYELQMLLIDK